MIRTITFERRYFASDDEFEYFLSQCGIKKENRENIDEVTIECDNTDITVLYDE